MKPKIGLLLFSFAVLISSCKKDEILPPPPEISGMETEYTVVEGEKLALSPTINNKEGATYKWTLDDTEVSAAPEYTFWASATGKYVITFEATNKGGSDQKKTTVNVLKKDEPPFIGGLKDEYAVTVETDLLFTPEIKGNGDITIEWLLEGKSVSNKPEYTFNAEKKGNYKLLLKATNKEGTTEKEIQIKVSEKGIAPTISNLKEEYRVVPGIDLVINPSVASDTEVTYSWILDEKEVANTSEYTFKATQTGNYALILKASNENGTSEKRISIIAEVKKQNLKTTVYTLLPFNFSAFESLPEDMKPAITKAPSELYRISLTQEKKPIFIAAKAGIYTLEVSAENVISEIIEIEVKNRPKAPSPYIAQVFDYLPAPGQFVNKLPLYDKGDTREDMVRKAGE